MHLFKNAHIIDPLNNRDEIADLVVDDDGIITFIGNYQEAFEGEIIDASAKILAPAFCDLHVHFRDPGQTYKEDLITGSNAALAGGYSHVVCMANTIPTIDTVERYQENQAKMEQLPLHVYQAASITYGLEGKQLTDLKALIASGIKLLTDDGRPILDENLLKEAMEQTKEMDIPLSFHEEDPQFITHAGVNEGDSRQAEVSMIARDIELAKKTHCMIHIQHISTKEGVELVRKAKAEGCKVHAEACPHHFSMTQEDVSIYGSNAKMNPPLREEDDRIAIIQGLKDGTIDCIATDHAPHSIEEKSKPLYDCPSGIIGLETALSLAITYLVKPGYLTYHELITRMSVTPASLLKIEHHLGIGCKANLVLFDPHEQTTYTRFKSKSTNSPWLNQTLTGKVIGVYTKGHYHH